MLPRLHFLISAVLMLTLFCCEVAANTKMAFYADEYPPYNYLNPKGELAGVSVEILKRVMLQINEDFSVNDIALMPWARAYKQLQERSDVTLFTMIKTQDREELFRFVGPISHSNMVVITKNAALQINNLNDLTNYNVAVVRDGLGDQLLQKMSTQNINAFRLLNPEQVIRLLINDRVDAIVLDEFIVRYQLNRLGEDTSNYHFIHSINYSGTYFAFNKNVDPHYFTRFEAEFAKLKTSGVIDQIYQNHLDNL